MPIPVPEIAPPPANRAIPDDDLLRHLRDACVAAGRVLSQTQFERLGKSADPACPGYRAYKRRWGRWATVLAALRVWVAAHDPGFPCRGDLPGAAVPDPPPNLLKAWPPPSGGDPFPDRSRGEPINIPGMLHAPVDAAGVVLLFGVLARELGCAIAHVSGAHLGAAHAGGRVAEGEALSCEVRRRHGDVWERRRLAFAFASQDLKRRHLETQGLAGHDLLVCWIHDWPDCPFEVIELRREAARHA